MVDEGRYIILGSVDGLLAVLGVVIGASSVSADKNIIISAALGGAVALALTNGVGSYLAEGAVEYGKLAMLSRPLLRSLENTHLERAVRRKIWMDSLTHGGASFAGSLVPIAPFVFLRTHMLETSIVLSILTLGALGVYSGKLARQNILMHIVRMVGLGIAIVVVVTLLGAEH
jgi:predicted membrane protein (TIGR00267 family)